MPRDDAGAHRHQPSRRSGGSTSPAPRRSTRSSTPSAASTPTATASSSSPTTSRPTRRRPATRSARRSATPRSWTVPAGGRTLVFGAGHLHPGRPARRPARSRATGPTPAPSTATTRPRSGRCSAPTPSYYEPAGAVSWDVSMEATRPDWRISLKAGDTVSIDATYDVKQGVLVRVDGDPARSRSRTADDPLAKDPFDDEAAVQAMYDAGGILTHGRLPENIDTKANKDLKLPDPRKLRSKGAGPEARASRSTASATRSAATRRSAASPTRLMRPPMIRPGQSVTFTNLDALSGDARRRAGLAQHHLVQGAVQPRLRDRLPARRRPDQVRLRPARLRHRHRAPR